MNPRAILFPVLLAFICGTAAAQDKKPVPKPAVKEPAKPVEVELPDRFDRKLNRDGVSFVVTWPAEGRPDSVEINPSGLTRDNSAVFHRVAGAVTGAVVEDLDGDGSPEIYLFVKSRDGKGGLVAYAVDRGKNLAPVLIASPAEDGVQGYRGGDEFRISGDRLIRTFPVYKDGDKDGSPGGGRRQITYKLYQAGESWRLGKELVVDI